MNETAKKEINDRINLVKARASWNGSTVRWQQKKVDKVREAAAGDVRILFTQYFPDRLPSVRTLFPILVKCPCMGSKVWKTVIESWNRIIRELEIKQADLQPDPDQPPKISIS